MAGHSQFKNIMYRKGAQDKKRAKLFAKLIREVMVAARSGLPEPDKNPRLRAAVSAARAANMPKDNIERAIKRASGEGAGDIEELTYEGYAPGGVAVMVTCLTDNRNRTAADVKHIFEKRGGNLGAQGSVGFLFDFRSIFVVETGGKSEDEIMEDALEAGADDVIYEDDVATIYAAPADFLEVKSALEERGLSFLSAETGYVPQNSVAIESKDDAAKLLKLLGVLEDNEDVQNVYSNYDIPDEWMDELQA